MKKLMTSSLFQLLVFISFSLSLTSCLDTDPPPEPTPYSYVAIYNAVPDSPDMHIFFNRTEATSTPVEGYNFLTHSPIPVGNGTFSFVPVNTSDTAVSVQRDFQANKFYSIFLVEKSDSTIESLVTGDIFPTFKPENAIIRVMHLSPDAPEVYVTIDGETQAIDGLSFKEYTDFLMLRANPTSFKLRLSGTGEVIDSVSNYKIEEYGIYSFLIRGYATPPEGSNDSLDIQLVKEFIQ